MKVRRFYSVLLLCFCLILSKPFSALADTATSSNAVMTLDLSDDDYSVMPMSSLGSVTNTVDLNGVICIVTYWDSSSKSTKTKVADVSVVNNRLKVYADVGTGNNIYRLNFNLYSDNLPVSGNYLFSFDYASDISHAYSDVAASLYSEKLNSNASTEIGDIAASIETNSGDLYISPMEITLTNISRLVVITYMNDSDVSTISGYASFCFTKSSGSGPSTAGTNTSTQDYQSDVSSSLSDLSSSVDSMTEDLSSAAENLEYISTSQNLIIQGIDNVIMHISDQLYAFWDQLYNLIHEPTYAKLEEILAALRAIANNSDIYAVVEEVREANEKEMANDNANTDKVIANDNANTDKVTDAVEKHGNFIIEGLKGLFIPSDDYFSSLFDDLNEFFKERFGFLYTPIDLLVRFIDLIYGADAEFTGIPFPELKWDGYVLLEAQTVGFDILEVEEFKNVQNILYFLTNLAMIGALISLIHKKFEEVMRN